MDSGISTKIVVVNVCAKFENGDIKSVKISDIDMDYYFKNGWTITQQDIVLLPGQNEYYSLVFRLEKQV